MVSCNFRLESSTCDMDDDDYDESELLNWRAAAAIFVTLTVS